MRTLIALAAVSMLTGFSDVGFALGDEDAEGGAPVEPSPEETPGTEQDESVEEGEETYPDSADEGEDAGEEDADDDNGDSDHEADYE